jgi:tripartite-type tricarboxylate transporter receptor subunit TctC
MRHSRRSFVSLMLTLAASPAAFAAPRPLSSRTIRFVVPFGAGRRRPTWLRASSRRRCPNRWASRIVVDNRPAPAAWWHGHAVAKAPPDGHTLLLLTNANAVSVRRCSSRCPTTR